MENVWNHQAKIIVLFSLVEIPECSAPVRSAISEEYFILVWIKKKSFYVDYFVILSAVFLAGREYWKMYPNQISDRAFVILKAVAVPANTIAPYNLWILPLKTSFFLKKSFAQLFREFTSSFYYYFFCHS